MSVGVSFYRKPGLRASTSVAERNDEESRMIVGERGRRRRQNNQITSGLGARRLEDAKLSRYSNVVTSYAHQAAELTSSI